MKYKVLLWLFLFTIVLFGTGITYSVFTSSKTATTSTQIAKFIFNAETLDEIDLSLIDLHPGTTKEYEFSVSNNSSGTVSNVTLKYNMIIKTYHFMPTTIKLYKIENATETLILTCDESYTRNDKNELVCNTTDFEMSYATTLGEEDNYRLEVAFPSSYNEEDYTNLVDFIHIEINSWQKIGSD